MIEIVSKEMCCGCGACKQICFQKSIHMDYDCEGFLYPVVNQEICIQCGQCEKVCPILNAQESDNEIIDCYIGYDKKTDDRLTSSSGGLFGILATSFLNHNGVVYGAAFDTDFSVHHIRIDCVNKLTQIKGSKYVQSSIEDTYLLAKKDLDGGRKVLFSGTACQIAGLKRFINRKDDNLVTVDVLCHGVPSPLVWKIYMDRLVDDKKAMIRSINFRSKENGWKKYMMRVEFLNNDIYCVPHRADPYMQVFLSNVCLRPSCHNCKFKKLHRTSDITLGDAWNIKNINPDMDDDKGTSIILIHTEKGEEIINSLKDKIKLWIGDINSVLPPSSDSRISVLRHPKRDIFIKKINKNGRKAFDWWEHTNKMAGYMERFMRKCYRIEQGTKKCL